ncbi:uncharacterized protein LOC126915895 isoform X1 [Bombus affinis]|uniref:uncharacterized protein LOC126915895 isoform X1 n=1 Tax=Bombus affinis TaxID=309941 RepID=UPI0021B6EFA3|nr:uncharacterized protein LOC126915895 isoform X1 [Bombus affinis]
MFVCVQRRQTPHEQYVVDNELKSRQNPRLRFQYTRNSPCGDIAACESLRAELKMFHARDILPMLICTMCLISYCASCSPDIGQPLDLSQFAGEWYFAAGTPVNVSLSKCGRFLVRQTSPNTFTVKFTALSYKNDIPTVFNIDGNVNGNDIVATWQLQGSKKRLGPFRHVIAFVKYDTVLGMLVCYESTHHQGYKFVMIWSRERSLPLPILKELRQHSRRMNDSRRVTQNLLVELMKYSGNNQLSQEYQHLRSKWYLEILGYTIAAGVSAMTRITNKTVINDVFRWEIRYCVEYFVIE